METYASSAGTRASGCLESSLSDAPDGELLSRLSREPRLAWILWQRHESVAENALRRSCRIPQEEREEILSKAAIQFFVQVTRHAAQVRNLAAWTATLTRNVARDHLRSLRKFLERHELFDENSERPGRYNPGTQFAWSAADSAEVHQFLLPALNSLSSRLREAAFARLIEGKSYEEIASSLQIPAATVRKRVQVARQDLRRGIAQLQLGKWGATGPSGGPQKVFDRAVETQFEIRSQPAQCLVLPIPEAGGAFRSFYFESDVSRRNQRLRAIRRYLEQHPRGWSKWLERAELATATGSWQEALWSYESCRRGGTCALRASVASVRILLWLGRSTEAAVLCEEAMRLPRSSAALLHLEGYLAVAMGQVDDAVSAWASAAALEKDNPAHCVVAAEWLTLHSRYAEAAPYIDRALAIAPWHLTARMLQLEQHRSAADWMALHRSASLLFEQGHRNASVVAHYGLSAIHCGRADTEHLRRILADALQQTPGFAPLIEAQSALLAATGNWHRLRAQLEEATGSIPGSAELWRIRGVWLYRAGEMKEALEATRRAVALDPRDPLCLEWAATLALESATPELFLDVAEALRAAGRRTPRLLAIAALGNAQLLGRIQIALDLSAEAIAVEANDPAVNLARTRVLDLASSAGEVPCPSCEQAGLTQSGLKTTKHHNLTLTSVYTLSPEARTTQQETIQCQAIR